MIDNNSLLPFELYLKWNGDQEIDHVEYFIDTVEKVLKEDLQRENSFGCQIKNCHTHVGSKKHLSSFIEAELLFHNSYYNKNFAYLTVNQMMNEVTLSDYENILIIGYETFSELYICEVVELLRSMGQDPRRKDFTISSCRIQYGIYEQTVSGQVCIRYSFSEHEINIKDRFPTQKTLLVFIVPINTTLTTHDKMMEVFFQSYGCENEKINCINFGLILIGPKDSSDYWKVSSGKRRVHLTKDWQRSLKALGDKPVFFFACINNNWYDVNRCPECFPDIDKEPRPPVQEMPIFEVNRASIIPMLQLRTKVIPRPFDEKEITAAKENLEKVQILSKFAYHEHLVRNGNHHQFYIDTRRFFNNQREDINNWLENIKKDIREVEQNHRVPVYNFIVAPRHYSNAGFVQLVNDVVFEGTARIFYFEAFKEFRGNIVAKYNDFSRIVNNIKLSGQKAKIKFHYIDDTIYSAGNYNRTKSLIKSLINNSVDTNNVDISIFNSVIVLLGRTSQDTNRNFVKEIDRFYQYVRLSISPMRSFDNACSLCNLKEQFADLKKMAATNKMDELCYEAIKKYEYSHVDNLEMLPPDYSDENKYKILIWHLLEERLNNRIQLDNNDNIPIISEDSEQILKILIRFKEKAQSKTLFKNMAGVNEEDVYKAFIKTITRPFFTFHIRRKQASFRFCLDELSQLIKQIESEVDTLESYFDQEDQSKFSQDFKRKFPEKGSQRELLNKVYLFCRLAVIVNGLSDMNAFFVIRAKVLESLIDIAQLNDRLLEAAKEAGRTELIKFLIFTRDDHYKSIKKLTGASRDDTKSLFLEHLVVEGDEENFFEFPSMKNKIDFLQFSDRLFLYLENNKVLRDGLNELTSTTEELGSKNRQNVEQLYFMTGYRKILRLSGKDPDEFSKRYKAIFPELKKAICANEYDKIIKCIRGITDNDNIQMFLLDNNKESKDKWDRYFNIENEDFTGEFYSTETINTIDSLLGDTSNDTIEVIGDSVYMLKSKDKNGAPPADDLLTYILRLSHVGEEQKDQFVAEDENQISLYFLVRQPPECEACSTVTRFFTAKLLLSLRSHFIKLVKNKELLFRINELKAKKLKTALSIENACQHIDREFFYGDENLRGIYSDNLENERNWSGRYLQLTANELISEMYRKVVRNSIPTFPRYYKQYGENIGKYFFEPKDGLYCCHLETYNKSSKPKPKIDVEINVNMKSLDERTFVFYSKSASTMPEFYLLLILIGCNAAQHYEGEEEVVVVDVYGDQDGYLVFENQCLDVHKGVSSAKERMNKAPMYFKEKEQSITLWTLNRYFQIAKESDVYKGYKELSNLNMEVDCKDNRFILRLPVLAEERKK